MCAAGEWKKVHLPLFVKLDRGLPEHIVGKKIRGEGMVGEGRGDMERKVAEDAFFWI